MGAASAIPVLSALGFGLINAFVAVGLAAWGRRVARRLGDGWGWRTLARLPLVGLALGTAATIVWAVLMARGLHSPLAAEPGEKAERLGAAISEAMNITAVFMVPAVLIYGASAIAYAAGAFRAPPR